MASVLEFNPNLSANTWLHVVVERESIDPNRTRIFNNSFKSYVKKPYKIRDEAVTKH